MSGHVLTPNAMVLQVYVISCLNLIWLTLYVALSDTSLPDLHYRIRHRGHHRPLAESPPIPQGCAAHRNARIYHFSHD